MQLGDNTSRRLDVLSFSPHLDEHIKFLKIPLGDGGGGAAGVSLLSSLLRFVMQTSPFPTLPPKGESLVLQTYWQRTLQINKQ